MIGSCYIGKCWKLNVISWFSQNFSEFSKKPIFSLFSKKVQNRVFGQFWPQIRIEHQKLGRGCFWTYQNLFFGKYSKNKIFQFFPKKSYNSKKRTLQLFGTTFYFSPLHQWKNLAKIIWAKICFDMKKSNVFFSKKNVFLNSWILA